MSVFRYAIYYLNDPDSGEILREREVGSADEAILACLDPKVKADFIELERGDYREVLIGQFSPYATWGTMEKYEELLSAHILTVKAQLNHDITRDQAAHALLVRAHETERHSR